MTRKFSAEFKLETAQLVIEQGYCPSEAARAMNVGLSTINKWVKQVREERLGVVNKPNANF